MVIRRGRHFRWRKEHEQTFVGSKAGTVFGKQRNLDGKQRNLP